jgi:hypothetical protein
MTTPSFCDFCGENKEGRCHFCFLVARKKYFNKKIITALIL